MDAMRSKAAPSRRPAARARPCRIWYAPHASLYRESTARQAAELADALLRNHAPPPGLTERELFIALHACAFRAAGVRPKGRMLPSVRQAWMARWQAVRNHIIEQNLGLVYSTLTRFCRSEPDRDDLASEAMLSLIRSVDRFNPFKGYRFSTYACSVIYRALMRRKKHNTLHRSLFPVQHDSDHERPVRREDPGTGIYVECLQRILARNEGHLTRLETSVLDMRFPRNAERSRTFREIGRAIGLSKERVRQIQRNALIKLRGAIETDPILR